MQLQNYKKENLFNEKEFFEISIEKIWKNWENWAIELMKIFNGKEKEIKSIVDYIIWRLSETHFINNIESKWFFDLPKTVILEYIFKTL